MTMKLTGTYNGKPIELELTEEQVEVLKQREKKKTGWERVEKGERYFINAIRVAQQEEKTGSSSDDTYYKNASYFANETLLRHILTAQLLQRKLWRRSAELCEKVNWRNPETKKYYIIYDYEDDELGVDFCIFGRGLEEIYFDTEEHAEQASKNLRTNCFGILQNLRAGWIRRNHDENPRNYQSSAQDGSEHRDPELPWLRI